MTLAPPHPEIVAPAGLDADISALWAMLSPAHRQIVMEIVQAFAALDQASPMPTSDMMTLAELQAIPDEATRQLILQERNGRLIGLLDTLQAEADALPPDEAADAAAGWDDFQQAMNANRAPEPPLFV